MWSLTRATWPSCMSCCPSVRSPQPSLLHGFHCFHSSHCLHGLHRLHSCLLLHDLHCLHGRCWLSCGLHGLHRLHGLFFLHDFHCFHSSHCLHGFHRLHCLGHYEDKKEEMLRLRQSDGSITLEPPC